MRCGMMVVSSLALTGGAYATTVSPSSVYIPAPGGVVSRIPGLNEGFETFAPGAISGQMGWTTFAANMTAPVISTANPASGVQHLRITLGAGAGSSLNGAFSPDFGDFVNESSQIGVDVFISQTGAQNAQFVGQAPSQGFLTWRVIFAGDGSILVLDDADGVPGGGLAFIDSGDDWTPGAYFNFRVDTDPIANSLTYYLNNSLIYTGSVGVFAGTAVEQVLLFGDNAYTSSSFTDYDNLSIVPAPGAGVLVGFAGLALLRRRR
jgi:hypothetical protein